MDKNQIEEIIKSNPQVTYEELKRQAIEVGVEASMFDEAWEELHPKKSKKKIVIIVGIVALVFGGAYYTLNKSGLLDILISVSSYTQIEKNTGVKTAVDCLNLSSEEVSKEKKDYRLLNISLDRESYMNGGEYCSANFITKDGNFFTVNMSVDKIESAVQKRDLNFQFEQMVNKPEVLNAQELIERARQNEQFNTDLSSALEENGAADVDEVLRGSSILFNRDHGKYSRMTIISNELKGIEYVYQIDVSSGDVLDRQERDI